MNDDVLSNGSSFYRSKLRPTVSCYTLNVKVKLQFYVSNIYVS